MGESRTRILGDMIRLLKSLNTLANRHAGKLFFAGLAAVALYNWRQWQRDKALLESKGEPDPLPSLEEWPDLPKVSVLVAAWNESALIERHIESFLNLRYPHKELVLCAGGEDGTFDLANQFKCPEVKVLEQLPGDGKQRALRKGFPETTGEVIFLTDADCWLDDTAFELTLYPVVTQDEKVCTGSTKPYPSLMENPFVVSQIATQIYSAMHLPEYSKGLLGRNCAIKRSLLAESRGLETEASTGTDYVLSKILVNKGVHIRHVQRSWMMSRYPLSIRAYLKQQRRWQRNVMLHGLRFGVNDEVWKSLLNSFIGLIMLLMPILSIFLGLWLLLVWLMLFVQAMMARIRYLLFTRQVLMVSISRKQFYFIIPFIMLDFVSWAGVFIDYLKPSRREAW